MFRRVGRARTSGSGHLKGLLLTLFLLPSAAHAATYEADPTIWAQVYAQAKTAGDVVLLADGNYPYAAIYTSGVTYRAVNRWGAVFKGLYLDGTTHDNVIDGIASDGSAGEGIYIEGKGHQILNVKVTNAAGHGILFGCGTRIGPPDWWCPPDKRPTANLVKDADASLSHYDGVKLDSGEGNSIISSRFHHNAQNGLSEGGQATHTRIEACEFDHNGSAEIRAHGVYIKGQSGHFYKNSMHHNTGYGLHCWAACFGTPDDPYDIRFNMIYANESGGTVIAGTAKEASPPGDGYPRYVTYWHNTETGNGVGGG